MKFPFSLLVVAICLAAVVEVRAHEVQYSVVFSNNEATPNSSPGTGTGLVTVDFDLSTMRVEANFTGLIGDVSVAHIHCCTAAPDTGAVGVATVTPTFTDFPSGVKSGAYDHTFDLNAASSLNPAFVTANGGDLSTAVNVLLAGFDSGRAYFNIHTSEFSGGEIRGFLHPVPEPTSALLMVAGLGGLAVFRRQRR